MPPTENTSTNDNLFSLQARMKDIQQQIDQISLQSNDNDLANNNGVEISAGHGLNQNVLHAALSQSIAAIALLSVPDFKYVFANEPYQQFFNKKLSDLINQDIRKVFPLIEEQGYFKVFEDVYNHGKTIKISEFPKPTENQAEKVFFDFNIQAIYSPNKQISHIMVHAVEVTEKVIDHNILKDSENYFRTLADTLPAIVWITRPDGYCNYLNQQWYGYTGQTKEEGEGYGWLKATHPDDVEFAEKAFLEANNLQKPFNFTYRLWHKDGYYRWAIDYGSPRFDEQGVYQGMIGTVLDIHDQKIANESLEFRQALLEAHNQASLDGILLVDLEGKILSFNDRFMEIWNMPKDIIESKDDNRALAFAMTQLKNPEAYIQKVKDLYSDHERVSVDEIEFIDGKIIERHGYPVVSKEGAYYAWSWLFRDITKQKNNETAIKESEQNFRQLAELLPTKVTNADTNGNVIYYNQSWLDYTGLSFDELKGWGLEKVFHPDEADAIKSQWENSLKTGEDFEREIRLRNKDGEYKWHLSLGTPIKDEHGKIIKWVGTNTEIQKIKEEEQRKLDFIKIASHELKTPLTSIKGYTQLLLKILEKHDEIIINNLPLKPSLLRIDSQIVRLSKLINELLDVSRIQESKLEFNIEHFNLNELVNDTIQDIRYSNSGYVININQDNEFYVNADKDRIGQVLINFIANAIKYSPGKNVVDIFISETDDKQVAVSVKDYGIGIDKKDQKKIFDRFYRVDGNNEKTYQGFGIGLFIVNDIILRHNGSIQVESEKGIGSVFTFKLPLG